MKQMEQKRTITFRWWRECEEEIKPEHTDALEEKAMDRIQDMMKESYTSGELHDNVRMTDGDGEDGVEYRGWWELTTVNNPS